MDLVIRVQTLKGANLMKLKSLALTCAAGAGLFVLTGVMAAKSAPSVEEPSGKVEVHHIKVYTIADEASRVLKDTEEQAYEMTEHTGTLLVATQMTAGKEFYIDQLDALREDVNDMGRNIARLEALRQNEQPWESTTVTRVTPLLKQLAATTGQAIRFMNDNPQEFGRPFPEYQNITQRLYDQSTTLWRVLHDSVQLADLRQKEERLRNDLQQTSE
jgi:hypothetical protein